MRPTRSFVASLVIFAAFAMPVAAQVSNPDADRVDRLERDIMLLQKQLARSGINVSTSASSAGTEALTPSADLEVRLSSMEETMRALQGKVEENDFEVRKLSENFEKFQKDTEFRFSELGQHAAQPSETVAATEAPASETTVRKPLAANAEEAAEEKPDGPTTAGDGVLRAPDPNAVDTESFDTPRDLYNYAFRLLNQTRYEAAASAFASFAKKYPKDPLIGNAYYWQGETFYIRRDYVNAADAFRQGFEALPSGPKAPDNLLKLAMSLDALDRSNEACVVLKQIITKFKKSSISIADKASKEQKRMSCK